MNFPYTVLLLNPDYLAVTYGKDVTLLHVDEDSRDDAVAEAQRQAFEQNEVQGGKPSDWHVLALFEGHHDNEVPATDLDCLLAVTVTEKETLSKMLRQVTFTTDSTARAGLIDSILGKLMRALPERETVTLVVTDAEKRALESLILSQEPVLAAAQTRA
jgi:hypothetical protein